MSFHRTILMLALVSAFGGQTVLADEPQPIDAAELQAAIASFGVPAAQSEKAAAAAVEEIAHKRREADGQATRTVSQIPDDLLDISPY